MKRWLLTLAILWIAIYTNATTYYTVDDGNWEDPIWSSVCSTCAGSTLPTLSEGDILIIDNQVIIDNGVLTIGPSVTVVVRTDNSPNTSTTPAKLIFTNGGKLELDSPSSTVVLENVTGNSANDPEINGSGNGGSNLISVGGVDYWRADDGDLKGTGTLQPGAVLPIKLISFVAVRSGKSIRLTWVTAMEKNFSHFQLERASENLNFIPLENIEGKGSLEATTSYGCEDKSPQTGKNYYRLKSIDYDGSFEYSPVALVDFKSDKQVMVYPNPALGGNINIRTNFSPQEGDRVEIYNNLGLKLMEFEIMTNENALPFNSTIKQGSYLLRYISRAHTQVIRFYAN
jgi:hypothetical protein